ncbi:MAG: hypothetical protein KAG53_07960 [Endozoicomonadaceae bacterium]|nr:hypothetical protein [Endozoicomonadaceae bacterium]
MTVRYMPNQDCLKLRLLDAFTYVKHERHSTLMESVVAFLCGKTIKISDACSYMSNSKANATLSNRFEVALKSRNIVPATTETVLPSNSSHLNKAENHSVNDIDLANQENNDLEKRRDCLSTEIKNIHHSKDNIEEDYVSQLKNKASETQKPMNESHENLQCIKKECNQLKGELEDINSKKTAMTDKIKGLTANKSNHKMIHTFDLSDPNIPPKLAKRFDGIYSNEYDLLMDELDDKHNDNDNDKTIEFMATMAKEAQEKAKDYVERTKKLIINEKIDQLEKARVSCNSDQAGIPDNYFLEDEKIILEQYLHNNQEEKLTNVSTTITRDWINEKYMQYDSEKLNHYLNALVRIMIYMELKTPSIECVWLLKGEKYDRKQFREHTRPASASVDFVVWPALLIGDEQLSKGIVQPNSASPENDNVK